jgi:hypothetical protein
MSWPKGVPRAPETIAKMKASSPRRSGWRHSEETKLKIAAARQAREALKPPKAACKKRGRNGWKWTDEQREKYSASRKGRHFSDEARARLADQILPSASPCL